eukprot:TRINITY_DN32954_c0_g1_i2.p2 TRINITY_DN32954_c0_g1~~TRINITY_DN32954_c0_g1_i2.p2  ORF type:complete len:112 (-),score=16.80 TRINITY_DN32954_c0_g1_i2:121-456(-)
MAAGPDLQTRMTMMNIGKKCPGCGQFIQKNDGCDVMMCGTTAHGRLEDALRNGGCGCIFNWGWMTLNYNDYYTGLDNQRHDGMPLTDRQKYVKKKRSHTSHAKVRDWREKH